MYIVNGMNIVHSISYKVYTFILIVPIYGYLSLITTSINQSIYNAIYLIQAVTITWIPMSSSVI